MREPFGNNPNPGLWIFADMKRQDKRQDRKFNRELVEELNQVNQDDAVEEMGCLFGTKSILENIEKLAKQK